jgi:uncharacterized protein YbjT (DUF2867 family)
MTHNRHTTLVLGGTGKTGRRVAGRLQTLGLPTRIGSRSSGTFDWESPETWEPALRGVGAVYVSYYPDLAVPGAADVVASFAQLAIKSGAPRLVLISGRGEPGAELGEQAVRDTGAELTVLRSTWFSQNFSESFFRDLVLDGEVALPAGETTEPFVDADDIADVAVAALTDVRHIGETYELTGPRLLSFADAVGEIAAATGREISYVPVSLVDFASALGEQGAPPEVVELVTYVFGEVLDGRNSHLADGVQRALGREPRDFGDYVRAAAETGVWRPAHRNAA